MISRMTSVPGLLLLAVLVGVPVGVGAFTFVYAKGFSYLSTDPRACVNCHVMNEQYDAWLKSGHRHAATCVECHLPHAGSGEVDGQGGARVPALGGVHAAELQGADRDHGARSADRAGELRAVSRGARARRAGERGAAPPGASTACTATPAPAMAPAAEREGDHDGRRIDGDDRRGPGGVCPGLPGRGGPHRAAARPAHQHLRAQAGGAPAVRAPGRGDRGHDGPEGVGPELAGPVRRLSQDVPAHGDQVRRARPRRQRRRPRGAEARPGPLAAAHLRRLRLRDRLSRPARPRLRPLRPGADAPRDREEAARRVPAVPRGEPRPVPLRRQGRRHRRASSRCPACRTRRRGT